MTPADIQVALVERDAAHAELAKMHARIAVACTRLMSLCDADVPLSLEGAIDAVALEIDRMRRAARLGGRL